MEAQIPDEFTLERYRILQRLAFNEDRLFAERSMVFVLASTLLVTAFSVSATKEAKWLHVSISGAGILLAGLWLYINCQAITSLKFWRTRIHLIEEKWPEKHRIYVARAKYYRGASRFEMPEEPDIDGELFEKPRRSLGTFFSTNRTILLWVPLVFLGLWIILLFLTFR